MTRPRKTDADLVATSEHLFYEIQMFRATAVALSSGLFPPGHVNFALLESFLVHGRNLLHFLFPERPQASDVLAEDYYDDPLAWVRARGELPKSLATVRMRANKQLAHLTYDRLLVKAEAWEWRFMDIWRDVEQKLRIFRVTAPSSRITPRWSADEVSQ
jgi:hypothetical protein